jgi:hypothetical protein
VSLRAHNVYWYGCYNSGLDLGTEDSVAHPAKMAWGLAFRIFAHLRELGLLADGDTVLDPMAGTGRTNVVAGALGYASISVELESQFMEFQAGMEEARQQRSGPKPPWTRLQGDARGLTGLLDEAGLVGVTSPPYDTAHGHPSLGNVNKDNWGNEGRDITKRRGKSGDYGASDGQIGAVSITSPPYDNRLSDADERAFMDPDGKHARPATSYGHAGGNIGNLRAVGVTSPPYDGQETPWNRQGKGAQHDEERASHRKYLGAESKGQLGAETGGTYATAMLQVYREMARCCRVAVIVTKNPTRAGRIHPLHRITARLLRKAGFRIVDYHRAILFSETQQADMFDSPKRRVRGRLSFFKRLSLNKGQPVARWEDVLFCVRNEVPTYA